MSRTCGKRSFLSRASFVLAMFMGGALLTTGAACNFKRDPDVRPPIGTPNEDARGSNTGRDVNIAPPGPCTGLRCQQTTCTTGSCAQQPCAAGTSTQVTGTVYDPAGKVPLYNAKVYIPNAALAELKEGPSCDSCDTSLSGDPIVQADTDVLGHFTLDNVPVGTDIPLVVQIGKWRRQTTIANVPACTSTALTDMNQTRLPRNKSEGHIPKIALTTGGLDALECLIRKIGIEDAEITNDSGDGRVHLFAGGNHNGVAMAATSAGTNSFMSGAVMTDAEVWWEQEANLNKYDIILHSCEGTSNPTNKSMNARMALQNFANAGGRVFASHWHNYWIEHGPNPWPMTANFRHQSDPASPFTGTIDQSFAKGVALAQWLVNVGASPPPGGTLEINGAKRTVTTVRAPSQRWIYNGMGNSEVDQYYSFTTPYGTGSCGKVVFSDLHVTAGSGAATDDDSDPTLPFPMGCRTTELSPQEKALEFMLFDLSACIIPTIP
jgi:hypothetical protein